jgi:hypothetical protein
VKPAAPKWALSEFGCRWIPYLPLNTHVEVIMDEQVKGNKTVIARLG